MTSDKTITGNKNKTKRMLGFIFSIILTLVFLYIAFRGVRARDVMGIISHASWLWVTVLFFSLALSHFIRAVRWKVILKSVKPDASLTNLFGSMMIGYGVNCVVPRVGELSRAIMLGKWEGLSRSSILGTVIVERVIDVIALAVSVLISVFIYDGDLYGSFPWLKPALYIISAGMAGVIFFLLLLIKYEEKFCNIIVKFTSRISPVTAQKLEHILQMLTVGFASIKGIKSYSLTFLFTALIILTYGFNSMIGFYTLDMQFIRPVTFSMAWVLYTISSFGLLIPTPGGTGSYHTITKTAIVLLFGFSGELSLAYAVLQHLISYVLFIGSALGFFFYLNYRYAKKMGKTESLLTILDTGLNADK
ncbi:MAG: lysylphosphatidylglycerol synthase transmembrane domain-containing protein [Ignavibacteria bacterium]